jgi:2-polyprenyl-6-hydroxyphenyl methylase/3-demethylubiquinone-9 3-methyltransferase
LASYDHAYVRSFDERESLPDATLFGHLYRKRISAAIAEASRLPANAMIVDFGCAQGNLARELASAGYRVTGVESNRGFLDYAKTRDIESSVTWVCSDICLFTSGDQYDGAVLTEVIEHTAKPRDFINAAARVLRPGGLLIVSTPNGERLRQHLPSFSKWLASSDSTRNEVIGPAGEHHRFLFTRKELRSIVSERFSDIRFRPISSVLKNRATARLLRWRLTRQSLDAVEAAALATPFRRRLANQWLVTARRRA